MTARKITFMAILAALLALPACGGDDDNDTGPAGNTDEAILLVSQANADIRIFCIRATAKEIDKSVLDTAFISAVQGVDVLVDQSRENPEIEVPLSSKQPKVPLQKIVRDNVNKLKSDCGKDGRLMAARLESAVAPG